MTFAIDKNSLSSEAIEFVDYLEATGDAVIKLVETSETIATGNKDMHTITAMGAAIGIIIIGTQSLVERSSRMKIYKTDQASRLIKEVFCLVQVI